MCYVAGKTASTDFPQTSGGFQEELLGIGTDVFVSRISGDLLTHYGSTYVGGTLAESSQRMRTGRLSPFIRSLAVSS